MKVERGIYKRGKIYWICYQGPGGETIRESTGTTVLKLARDTRIKRQSEVIEGKLGRRSKLAFSKMADLYWEVYGQLDDAVVWLDKAMDLDPGNPDHSRWMGMIFIDLGDNEAGAYWIRHVSELAPDRFNSIWGEHYLQKHVGTADDVRAVIDKMLRMSPQNSWAMLMLAKEDILAGRTDAGLEKSRAALPDLMDIANPAVDKTNYGIAIDLAYILIQANQREHANLLLNRSLRVIESKPRLGYDGYKIRDVEIHALLGNKEEALSNLRSAVDAGWRYSWRFEMKSNANLESLRSDPRFQTIVSELQVEMTSQLARVNDLKEAGELPE